MADAVTIQAQARDPQKNKGTGSRVSRRLRAQGRIPAIIYGHKQAPQPVSLARDDVWAMIKKSTHLAQLTFGDASETVLVRDVQWDHLGKEIIHLDFARVSADEAIHTTVPLELHGTAPGVGEGGVLTQVIHSIAVTCRANAIPDHDPRRGRRAAAGPGHPRQGPEAPRGADRPGRPRPAPRPRRQPDGHHRGRPRRGDQHPAGTHRPQARGKEGEEKAK